MKVTTPNARSASALKAGAPRRKRPAELTRLKRAVSSVSTDWLFAAYDDTTLHLCRMCPSAEAVPFILSARPLPLPNRCSVLNAWRTRPRSAQNVTASLASAAVRSELVTAMQAICHDAHETAPVNDHASPFIRWL